jgi:hypothetical protein
VFKKPAGRIAAPDFSSTLPAGDHGEGSLALSGTLEDKNASDAAAAAAAAAAASEAEAAARAARDAARAEMEELRAQLIAEQVRFVGESIYLLVHTSTWLETDE